MGRIYPLFSSSSGNATYIGNKESGILIDAGVSYTRLLNVLNINDIDISAVKAIFVTHSHSDHISGIKALTKKQHIKVYAQQETLNFLCNMGYLTDNGNIMCNPVIIENMEISCFNTPHDTEESCGYKIKFNDNKTCAICTDLGHITETVSDNLYGTDAVLIESNYDDKMLATGPYPPYLKSRIRSDTGHLSNRDCGRFCCNLIKNGTTRLILGHLSQKNNTPETAENTVISELSKEYRRNTDYLLSVAKVESCGGFISF